MPFQREQITMSETIQVKPLEVSQVRLVRRLGAVQVQELYNPASVCIIPSPLRQVHVGSIEEALTAISFGLRFTAFGLGDASEFGFPLLRAHLLYPGLLGGGEERLVLDGLGGGDA